eukprot:TRINITY_DN6109_c0_g1_i2.p1 TRINITY_DN6109_c0_g1~~TRINITY_DN6109_c0_g1_i2.p1  ORF type:complete len:326 (-),score=59.99 TRINITY_DN6109_c0_g1_i2:674-1651(-)
MAALVVESSSLDNIPTSNNNNSSNNNNNNNNNDKNVDGDDQGIDQNRGMRELVDLLSKLNPLAEEFVPHKGSIHQRKDDNNRLKFNGNASDSSGNSVSHFNSSENGNPTSSGRRRKNGFNQGRRRQNGRNVRPQQEDSVRRTVYVSDIDQHVTEEQLAALFLSCGQVIDCRICGDPNSVLRFAFIEFADEAGARRALSLSGTMLGFYPVRVLPSKTAIHPVNPTFLPRSEDEREMCARTVYCTNIDKRVSQTDVRMFFESLCGEVSRLRLLGDNIHSTRIAFVEFVMAESAILALNCSGAILGSLPIRVSPSKTPVRPRIHRPVY